jgi:hypothetical protein
MGLSVQNVDCIQRRGLGEKFCMSVLPVVIRHLYWLARFFKIPESL